MIDIIPRCFDIIRDYFSCEILSFDESERIFLLQDDDGYKYTCTPDHIINKHHLHRFHKYNFCTLENISFWMETENIPYLLLQDNVYSNNKGILELYCKDCDKFFSASLSQLKINNAHSNCCSKEPKDEIIRDPRPPITKSYNFGAMFPDLVLDWDSDTNGSPFKYYPFSTKEVSWICHVCGHKWKKSIGDRTGNSSGTKRGLGCSICAHNKTESYYQKNTREYIESLGYLCLHERDCNLTPINPRTGYELPYDNELPELKLIIEVHGDQHSKMGGFHAMLSKRNSRTIEEEFEYHQWKDKFKEEFAISNGYYYLVVSYDEFDKNETYKKSIDNAIKYIIEEIE